MTVLWLLTDNQIRVTEFDVSSASVEQLGEEVQTFDLAEGRVVTPIQTIGLPNGNFIVAYRIYTKWPGETGPRGPEEMLHVISPDWNTILQRTLSYDYLGVINNPYVEHEIGGTVTTLQMAVVDSGKIAVSPYFYEGEILLIEKMSEEKWKQTKKLTGYVDEREAFEYYSNASSAPGYSHHRGSGAAVHNNESIGLFKTPEGGADAYNIYYS